MELHDFPSTFQKALQVYGRCGRTRTGTVLSLQSYQFRHNQKYTKISKDIIYPNPSTLVCDVARTLLDTHHVTKEQFFGFGYDDRVEHCLDVIHKSTGLINDPSVPMKKAKIIMSFANYCNIDLKVAYTLSMLKGLDSAQGARFVCTLAAVMETGNFIHSSFMVEFLCSYKTRLLQLKKRDELLKQVSDGRYLGFGGDAYQIVDIVNRLANKSDNIHCVDTKSLDKCIKKRRYIFKNWEKYAGYNACVAYSTFIKKFCTQKESRTRSSDLFLIQMSLASSHHLQLAYLERDQPPCWAQAFILYSSHPVIVDFVKTLEWPTSHTTQFCDFYNHDECEDKDRRFFLFFSSRTDVDGQIYVSKLMCLYHGVGCYVSKIYGRRVSKKKRKENRDTSSPFVTPLKVYDRFSTSNGAIFEYPKFFEDCH